MYIFFFFALSISLYPFVLVLFWDFVAQNYKEPRQPNEYRNLRFYLNKIPLVPDGECVFLFRFNEKIIRLYSGIWTRKQAISYVCILLHPLNVSGVIYALKCVLHCTIVGDTGSLFPVFFNNELISLLFFLGQDCMVFKMYAKEICFNDLNHHYSLEVP